MYFFLTTSSKLFYNICDSLTNNDIILTLKKKITKLVHVQPLYYYSLMFYMYTIVYYRSIIPVIDGQYYVFITLISVGFQFPLFIVTLAYSMQ